MLELNVMKFSSFNSFFSSAVLISSSFNFNVPYLVGNFLNNMKYFVLVILSNNVLDLFRNFDKPKFFLKYPDSLEDEYNIHIYYMN